MESRPRSDLPPTFTPPTPPPARRQGGRHDDGEVAHIKETLQSILVAFILAFIFRAFVAEAFVIPTGSMASTLLGAHYHFVCPDCGKEWDTDFPLSSKSDELNIPSSVEQPADVFCPNCGYRIVRGTKPIPVYYGDRILVLKYQYLERDPSRWDVVVFKTPDDPVNNHYVVNYIKRLTGLPGETLMILDGDIYISTEKDKPMRERHWQIQTKPREAQEAMWRGVYDNDFHPQNLPRSRPWAQPWQAMDGRGWDTGSHDSGRVFDFENLNGTGVLEYKPEANPQTHSMNWLPYDQVNLAKGATPHEGSNDLKIDLFYQRQEGQGPLRLQIKKLDDLFVAEVLPDKVRLWRRNGAGADALLGEAAMPSDARRRPVRLEFMVVDYRVALRVDGDEALATTPQQYAPDVPRLVRIYRTGSIPESIAQISAQNVKLQLQHVKLLRDVYYTTELGSGERIERGGPYDPDSDFSAGSGPVTLGSDEFFVCGDNSAYSSDARRWDAPLDEELLRNEGLSAPPGRVPRRFMLGRAFFVYWPAGYRAWGDSFPIIPDFGEMRFIH